MISNEAKLTFLSCLNFFYFLFKDELDETACVWNMHIIRPSRNHTGPSGRPDIMYNVPCLYNAQECLIPVPLAEIQACKSECIFREACPYDDDVLELCNFLKQQYNWETPRTLLSCTNLYLQLREKIRTLLV